MAGMWSKLKKSLSLKHSQRPPISAVPQPYGLSVTSAADSNSRSPVSRSSGASFSLFSRTFSSKSSTRACAICLGNVKAGKGQAIFTAECSHSFHFSCIANSVRHGFHHCPVCRSKWKDLPFQFPTSNGDPQRNFAGPIRVSLNQSPLEDNGNNSPPATFLPGPEPIHFSDDEPLLPVVSADAISSSPPDRSESVTVKAFPELPAIAASESVSTFAVLVGVRAPPLVDDARNLERAPIDLVTVLDVSGSMVGSKLSLLKRAVHFVIRNLGPSDRLAIVIFSSSAQRIFPLHRMSDRGREDAILAVNSLQVNGGTNIVEGLKKGTRILHQRRERNPVASIILLSDGNDTYDLHDSIHQQRNLQNQNSTNSTQVLENLNLLLDPIRSGNVEAGGEVRSSSIPVHTFGFGADHDSASMHAISDASGGTFSFIETDHMVQDAFARCIGGLLSVVAQEVRLTVKSASSGVHIRSIPSGRYVNDISEQGQQGVIDVGDLYADEGKEFLIYLTVPVFLSTESEERATKTSLLDVKCSYKEILSMEMVQVEGERVDIRRPDVLSPSDLVVSLEVDRQKNRLLVAESIVEAQQMAEQGNLEGAQAVLANQRSTLLSSVFAQAGDGLCTWLESELTEIRERMVSMESYEHTGRAYVHSGLSSHSWQRATTRGDSTTQTALLSGEGGNSSGNTGVFGYDTPSMVSMVSKSQTLGFINHPEPVQRLNKSCILTPRS